MPKIQFGIEDTGDMVMPHWYGEKFLVVKKKGRQPVFVRFHLCIFGSMENGIDKYQIYRLQWGPTQAKRLIEYIQIGLYFLFLAGNGPKGIGFHFDQFSVSGYHARQTIKINA